MATDVVESKTPARRRPRLRDAFRVGTLQAVLVLCGMIFIRRDVYLQGNVSSVFQHWQESWVVGAMFVDGLMRGAYGLGPYISPFRKRVLRLGLPIALFFYAASATLCTKLNVGALDYEWTRDAGVGIVGVSLVLNLLSSLSSPLFVRGDESCTVVTPGEGEEHDSPAIQPTQPDFSAEKFEVRGVWRFLRYPDRFSILVMLSGLTLALGTWVPLLGLPGLFVAFKWETSDLESFRISQFGDAYLNYRKTSCALLPFIY